MALVRDVALTRSRPRKMRLRSLQLRRLEARSQPQWPRMVGLGLLKMVQHPVVLVAQARQSHLRRSRLRLVHLQPQLPSGGAYGAQSRPGSSLASTWQVLCPAVQQMQLPLLQRLLAASPAVRQPTGLVSPLRPQHRLMRAVLMLMPTVWTRPVQLPQQRLEEEGGAAAEGGAGEETQLPEAASKLVHLQPTRLHQCLRVHLSPWRLHRRSLRSLQPCRGDGACVLQVLLAAARPLLGCQAARGEVRQAMPRVRMVLQQQLLRHQALLLLRPHNLRHLPLRRMRQLLVQPRCLHAPPRKIYCPRCSRSPRMRCSLAADGLCVRMRCAVRWEPREQLLLRRRRRKP